MLMINEIYVLIAGFIFGILMISEYKKWRKKKNERN